VHAAVFGEAFGPGVVVEGRPAPPPGGAPDVAATPVSPEYFQVFRIPLLRGRAFTAADRSGTSLVLIVNQAFAGEFFPGQNAIGKHVRFGSVRLSPWREIVGIAGNTRNQALERPDVPRIYVPYPQMPDSLLLVLRSGLPPASLAADSKRLVQGIDPDQPIADVGMMEEIIHGALAEQRTNMLLMGIFAGLALMLASVGIFGVIAYLVSRRSHEIGIRLALGAQRGDVLGLVFVHAMRLTATGIGLGLGGALLGTRVLHTLLYETKPYDPATLTAVAALFVVVAMAAVYWPARQASRLDPVVTLRHE
jgi:putative ABC transport system permease protein